MECKFLELEGISSREIEKERERASKGDEEEFYC